MFARVCVLKINRANEIFLWSLEQYLSYIPVVSTSSQWVKMNS